MQQRQLDAGDVWATMSRCELLKRRGTGKELLHHRRSSTTMNTFKLAVSIGVAVFLSSAGSAQNLITNGNFENPTTTPSLGTVVTPTGWTPGGAGRVDARTYVAEYGGVAPVGNGARFAAFNGFDVPGTASISQSVNLLLGEEYNFGFVFGNFNAAGAPRTQTLTYTVSDGVNTAITGVIPAVSNTNTTNFATLLQQFGFLFVAPTTGAYNVTFSVATANGVSSDGVLDNVFLRRTAPELNGRASLPLALLLMLGCSLWSRRRQEQGEAVL